MTLTTIFLTAYLMGFSGAMAPGPLLTVTVNEVFRRGFKAGPQLITGHVLLEVVTVAAIAGGVARLAQNKYLYACIGILGGLYIAWMGWQLVGGAVRKTIRLDLDATPDKARLGPLAMGAATSLANPYFVIWWLTVGAGYVLMSLQYGIIGVCAFFLGHILADYTWYALVSGTVAGGRRFINQTVYRTAIFACGVFLLGMATWFIRSGIGFVMP